VYITAASGAHSTRLCCHLSVAPSAAILVLAFAGEARAASPYWSHFTLSGGPAVNFPQSPAYDSNSNRLINFGGLFTNLPCCTSSNETWVVSDANNTGGTPNWSQLSPAGTPPAGRTGHSSVYDQTNNRLIIFGGGQFGSSIYNVRFKDVWVLTNANGIGGKPTWTPLAPTGTPPAPREGQQTVYDPNSNRLIVFGGGNNGIMDVPADVWVLTNANGLGGMPQWIQLLPEGGNAPSRRQGFGMGYDPATNRALVFGGCCGQLRDLWVLQNANGIGGTASWLQLSQGSPSPGAGSDFASGYDPGTNRFIMTSGLDGSRNARNPVWALSGANGIGTLTWVNTIPDGSPCSPPRGNPVGVYSQVQNQFFSFTSTTDLWVLSDANSTTPGDGCPPPTGTITVTTNSIGASFSVSGPATFTGSGLSKIISNAPPGDYIITWGPSCRSDLPMKQAQILHAGQQITFNGTYSPGPLAFPLHRTFDGPCTTPIHTVFDHFQEKGAYMNDFVVTAYTGETGWCDTTGTIPAQKFYSPVGKKGRAGFAQPSGKPFSVNGTYTGGGKYVGGILESPTADCRTKQPGKDMPSKTFLFYDGHPGYDFSATCGTAGMVEVHAAVDGIVSYPQNLTYPNGLTLSGLNFHILQLTPDFDHSYGIYYLHLASYPGQTSAECLEPEKVPPNTHVIAGQVIGHAGYAGLPGPGFSHLHFEVQRNGTPIDPYGWKGTFTDPYSIRGIGPGVSSVNLWQ
jgi:hypothetical protein